MKKELLRSSKKQTDLFGNHIETTHSLREKYIEPPFSVLDARRKEWQDRKRYWISLGIKSEVGRDAKCFNTKNSLIGKDGKPSDLTNTSIFDPVLTELIYSWFCKKGGIILDPFAGGSVRGIIAHLLGYKYFGIELRKEQVESNNEQAKEIIPDNIPKWICGDSNKILEKVDGMIDLIFTCPPYVNLEKYSDLKEDLSNKTYPIFLKLYKEIIEKSCNLLKKDCFAIFVVGEVRDKNGFYYGFVSDTIKIFQEIGMNFYNEGILLTPLGTASLRANGNMKSKKLVKVHQNILCFIKK